MSLFVWPALRVHPQEKVIPALFDLSSGSEGVVRLIELQSAEVYFALLELGQNGPWRDYTQEYDLGQRLGDFMANEAVDLPSAVSGIEPLFHNEINEFVVHGENPPFLGKLLSQAGDIFLGNKLECCGIKRIEKDAIIYTVQQFRSKSFPEQLIQFFHCLSLVLLLRQGAREVKPYSGTLDLAGIDVARHNDETLAEINNSSPVICKEPFAQNLE